MLAVLALAAGCGGGSSSSSGPAGNGIAAKAPAQILAAAQTALRNAKTVRITAALQTSNGPLSFDIKIVSGRGGAGTLSTNGLGFQMVRIADKAYFNAPKDFWERFGNAAAAKLYAGKWIVSSAVNGKFASFTPITQIDFIANALNATGTLTKGKATTLDGHPAFTVTSSKGGTLYVATTGPPYPLKITDAGSTGGEITLSDWNAPVTLSAPAGAIDYAKITGG
jgi:hypothetical protein